MERLMGDATKIRKRGGCSPSSSTSSLIQNYKVKRAILVRKKGGNGGRGGGGGGGGGGGSGGGGSTTPVPTWRMVGSRSPSVVIRVAASNAASPRYPPSMSGRSRSGQGQGNGQAPVSARKLAATLWELNGVPSPSLRDEDGLREKRVGRREKVRRSSNSGSLPPHLSDPSHSPISERMERSGSGTHRRRDSSISRKLKMDHFDSVSNASFMEVETRSRCQTPSGSITGGKNRLKDVSNALTTSKELLKIISRMWGNEDLPSSSMSLISALHSELERARLQINQLIQEDRPDSNKEINYLLKRFAEEKEAWKNKEKEAVEAAVESVAGELEVERKLRRRLESLNKKLGKELGETKLSLLKAVKELQSEKKARGIIEQVCDELAGNIGEDRAQVAEMKRESVRMQEEFEKEREMLQIAEALREERTQMKLSDAKHQFEEKNAAVDKLRSELETFLRTSSSKENGCGSVYRRRDGDLAFCRSEAKDSDRGEVDNSSDDEVDNSDESDLHSIELNTDDQYKNNYKMNSASMTPSNIESHSVDKQLKGRKSIFNQVARRSTSLLRSVSNIVEWGNGSSHENDKQIPRRSCGDEIQRHKSGKSHRDHILPSSRLGLEREVASPSSQHGSPWPSREPCNVALQRPMTTEGHNSRRSRR